jgi:hypothetical protein
MKEAPPRRMIATRLQCFYDKRLSRIIMRILRISILARCGMFSRYDPFVFFINIITRLPFVQAG